MPPPNEIKNDRHRKVAQLYIRGYTLKEIADECGYNSRNNIHIVTKVLRRLRADGYEIPHKNATG